MDLRPSASPEPTAKSQVLLLLCLRCRDEQGMQGAQLNNDNFNIWVNPYQPWVAAVCLILAFLLLRDSTHLKCNGYQTCKACQMLCLKLGRCILQTWVLVFKHQETKRDRWTTVIISHTVAASTVVAPNQVNYIYIYNVVMCIYVCVYIYDVFLKLYQVCFNIHPSGSRT